MRARRTAGAPEAPESEVERIFAEIETIIDERVHTRVSELLAGPGVEPSWDRRYMGGVAGDTTKPASDLVDAAEHALAGNAAEHLRALEILERAREHQSAYLERLREAAAEPRRRVSHEMWRAAGVKSNEPDKHLTLIRRAETLLINIRNAIADPTGTSAAQSGRGSVREGHGRKRLQRERIGRLVAEALGADDPARARGLLLAYHSRVDDGRGLAAVEEIGDERLLLAGRLSRAEAAIGKDDRSGWVDEALRVSEERLERLAAVRAGGDEAERESFRRMGRWRYSDLKEIPRPESADQVLALARAMCRTPARFRVNERVRLIDQGPAPVVVLNIPVRPEGLRDLERAHRASAHWEGLRLVDRDGSHRGGKRALHLAGVLATQVGDQQVQIVAHTAIGTTRFTRDDSQRPWLEAEAGKLGLSDQLERARRMKGGEEQWDFGANPILGEPRRGLSRTSRSRDLRELIGEDVCAHPSAQWVADGPASGVSDTARLTCPDCHRTRIACVPLHRLPEGHPLAPDQSEREYLARERYYAELAGDRRPVRSVAALRERDGLADLDPASYRSGERGPTRASSSMASAFAGSRRLRAR